MGGEAGWIPKVWLWMNLPSQRGSSNHHHLPLAGGGRTWARVPESKKAGATGCPEGGTLWAADCSSMMFLWSALQLWHHEEVPARVELGTRVGRGINNILDCCSLGSI